MKKEKKATQQSQEELLLALQRLEEKLDQKLDRIELEINNLHPRSTSNNSNWTTIQTKPVILREDDKLNFGKYKNKTVKSVYLHNKEYLDWCSNNVSGFDYIIEDENLLHVDREQDYYSDWGDFGSPYGSNY